AAWPHQELAPRRNRDRRRRLSREERIQSRQRPRPDVHRRPQAVPGLVGHRCAERRKGRVGEIINYGSANTQIPPPLGGSGILPGNRRPNPPFIPATSPAHPDSTARYCLPSTVNVLGGATIPELVSASHSSFPVAASKACTFLSLVPPVNTRLPAVVSIEPQ